ncbi:hypothetical protein BG005_002276 [Podila minutissima]|nr:hypothetical protein BG005_002276 [Podila minutissima]
MSPTAPRTDDSTSSASSTLPVSSSLASSTSANPLQTLNSSLKRIRLNDARNEPGTPGSDDSLERAWSGIDPAELDEAFDVITETELPSPKKPRREIKDEDEDEDDDFVVSSKLSVKESEQAPPSSSFSSSNIGSTSDSTPSATKSISTIQRPSLPAKSSKGKLSKPTRSNNGMEDVFTHEQVRTWSEVRIKTWEHRRTNTEGFYYRFVDPTEGQQNGAWGKKSQQEFLERLEEWKSRGIRIGTSWGVFSMGVSHKAGYQCSSYYRKLLENKTLTDPAYAWESGKLVMVQKSSGGEMAISGLSARWDTEEVKEIESNINRWIKEYHSNGASRPIAKVKRVETSVSSSSGSGTITTGSRTMTGMFRPTTEAPRVKATTASAGPKALSLRPSKQPIDESEMIPVVDIDDKLAEYSSFMKKSTSTSGGPNKIRQTISLTVPGTVHTPTTTPARGVVSIEVRKSPLATHTVKGQTGLSLFWKNIRPVRVECPDALISKYIIPKDVEQRPTWAHRVQAVTDPEDDESVVAGSIHKEVQAMADFDWTGLSENFDDPVTDIQGIMADPPWNFIVEDGRNDGACKLTTKTFGDIMEKALELMPSGIVCVWTHKAILPEVVSIMHGLGCRYVENLVWYKIALNNTNLDRASPYFRTSKEILLMFKKGDGFDIRHQRTADVIMDFEKPTSAWIEEDYTEPKPAAVFEMMEILLPDARYMPEAGRGRLLEIWAKKDPEYRRSGWLSIHELKGEAPEGDIVPLKAPSVPAQVIDIDDDSDAKSDDIDLLLRDNPEFEASLRDIDMEVDA